MILICTFHILQTRVRSFRLVLNPKFSSDACGTLTEASKDINIAKYIWKEITSEEYQAGAEAYWKGLKRSRKKSPEDTEASEILLKPDLLFVCEICFEKFSSRENLDDHIVNHDDHYICEVCDKGFKKIVDYTVHVQSHRDDQLYKCPLCDYNTPKTFLIKSHLLSHQVKYEGPIEGCKKSENVKTGPNNFKRNVKPTLRSDTSLERRGHFTSKSNNGPKKIRKLPDESVKRFLCELCSEPELMTLKELNRHYLTHDQRGLRKYRYRRYKTGQLFPCEICSENLDSLVDLERHLGTHEDQYSCDVCKRGFKQIIDYIMHTKIHTEDKLFRCALCDYSSENVSRMKQHVLSHDRFKCYRCDIQGCNMAFTVSTHFEEHKKYFHTGEKSYACDICDQKFMYERVLNRHKETCHNIGPKRYKCRKCGEVFPTLRERRNHLKTHQDAIVCGICGKKVGIEYFKVHERMHTGERPFKCEHCGKAFPSKPILSQHERIHTGYRPHKCEICERCFTQRSSLVRHVRGHTGEKPFSCHFCSKRFVYKSALTSHIKNCTG